MQGKLELINEMKEKRKISLIQKEIERYDLIGNCIAHNPLKIKQKIFSAICNDLFNLEINMIIPNHLKIYAEEVGNFYRDISSYRLEKVLKLNQGDKKC